MTRTFYPRAWYADALPSGEYAVLYPHERVETHRGGIALPPGEPFGPRFVRVSNVGGFKFAGQADAGGAWKWSEGSGWRLLSVPCVGTSPVIYDFLGVLHSSDGSIGSQGWRYVAPDGTPAGLLVTGDQTYRKALAPGLSLYEWSAAGPLLIGQGQDGGVWVWDGLVLRLIEAGDGRFIRVQDDGERVAIAFMKSEGAVIIQTTIAELLALPTSRPPAPIPQPEPEPVPMSSIRLPDDVHAIVVALHAQHPDLAHGSDDDRRTLQRRVCETVRARKGERWGWKSNHPNGAAPAKDAIAQLPDGERYTPNVRQRLHIWDLVNGGTRQPFAQPVMSIADGSEVQYFIPVAPIDHLAGAAPSPSPEPPPAPPVDLSPLLAYIQELEERIERLESRKIAIKTHDGHYLCAEQGGGGPVNATRIEVGGWETFTIESQE